MAKRDFIIFIQKKVLLCIFHMEATKSFHQSLFSLETFLVLIISILMINCIPNHCLFCCFQMQKHDFTSQWTNLNASFFHIWPLERFPLHIFYEEKCLYPHWIELNKENAKKAAQKDCKNSKSLRLNIYYRQFWPSLKLLKAIKGKSSSHRNFKLQLWLIRNG